MDAGLQQRIQAVRDRVLASTRWFVTDEVRAQGEMVTTRALLLVLMAPMVILVTVAPALAQLFDGQPTPLTPGITVVCCLMFALGPFILRWAKSVELAGGWMLLGGFAITAWVIYAQHGLASILTIWLLVIPVVAGFLLGARWTWVFSLLSVACILGLWGLAIGPGFGAAPPLPEGEPLRALNLISALAATSLLAVVWERSAARIRREREELEAAVRRGQQLETVGMLAGGIAHDFNNILAAILGHASLLETEVLDAGSRRRVRAIVDSSRRAALLVEQMLAYAGRSHTHSGALDVALLVGEVVELVRPALDKNTELVLELGKLPKIVADPVQVQQIAMNLVTNASEALDGKPGRVWVRTAVVDADGHALSRPPRADDFVLIEVRDQGCGIPPDKLERIFDPFYTTKPSGHGLGLAAVLGIVRSHGGDIEVDSTVGQGTRFCVWLPCADAEALAAAAPEEAPRPRVRLPTMNTLTQLSHAPIRRRVELGHDGPGCVLVVDDETMVRELVGEVLEHAGHRVLLGCDGEHGLRVFEAHVEDIDLVILDRTMPGRDGLELLAEMRRLRPELPAIISSGYADDGGSQKLSTLGVDAVLQKPWAPRDLVELVAELGLPPRRDTPRVPRASSG